jgi:sensor histidine kinase YesM
MMSHFENKFDYAIHIDSSIDGDYDEIPPMLIQPYLENAKSIRPV